MIVTLTSDALNVSVDSDLGGSIRQIFMRRPGRRLLVETPWQSQCSDTAPLAAGAGVSEWLERYPGGWQILLPNAGPAGDVAGIPHGWHGEASLNPFRLVERSDSRVVLARDLVSAPLRVQREIAVDGQCLSITEHVHNTGAAPYQFLWQHHPAFGADLLEEVVRLRHCVAPFADEDVGSPASSLGFVAGLPPDAWAALEQMSGPAAERIGVVLAWDATIFPIMWIWRETGADSGPPWFGRLRAVGIEPAQSWPVTGLRDIDQREYGQPTVLDAGESKRTVVRLACGVGQGAVDELLTDLQRHRRAEPVGSA